MYLIANEDYLIFQLQQVKHKNYATCLKLGGGG